MQRVAVLLVWCGLIALCGGLWVLVGYAWALIAFGAILVVFGLFAIDVDKGGGSKSA